MQNSLGKVLQKHHKEVKKSLSRHKKAYTWLLQKGATAYELRQKSAQLMTLGALGGTLLFSQGNFQNLTSGLTQRAFANQLSGDSIRISLAAALAPILPSRPEPLTPVREGQISDMFKKYLNINASAVLNDVRLPTSYGYTGAEQHLARFPGDSMAEHDEEKSEGMAPGLGAWGYFASSRESMTPEVVSREKYYIAAQTFNVEGWNTRQPFLKDWFKYRKVLVVNPRNGEAAVAVVGDSGPADWTGKQFGCSPELMHHLKLDFGMKKGEVIIFFISDPDNKIPIGPIDYDNINVKL